MQIIELIKSQLVGKEVEHTNNHHRKVVLKVEDVKVQHHSRQITQSTPENDWWGESADWDTIDIYFTDGSKIECSLTSELIIK